MIIRLWRGFHSPQLLDEVRRAWFEHALLILCPPYLDTFDFCRHLPEGELRLIGDWANAQIPIEIARSSRRELSATYPQRPILGVFTSGTVSGQARLVLYTKEQIDSSVDAIFALFDSRRVSTLFCYAQPFHTFGLLLGYVMSLKIGAQLITPEGKYSGASHLKRLKISDPDLLTLGTPAHFFDLIETVRRGNCAIADSYSCIMGGASVSLELWRQVRRVLKIEAPSIGYGCSEASPGITHLPPGLEPLEDSEIGFALSNLSSEFSSTSVKIRGPSLCLGVIDANGLSFDGTREIRDWIRRREDGVLVFEGRSDLVLNRGGEKISLEMLEGSAHRALGVELLAVPVPDRRLGHDLGLVIKNHTGDPLHAEGEVLVTRLQKFFKEVHHLRVEAQNCVLVEEIPRNATFKPNRFEAFNLLTHHFQAGSSDTLPEIST